ncbi:hypothetical protein EDB89DRAFT_2224873 [Lactarius sanguifluus]|nr:hypothetical protein EDB89DRAFT_2224873 [Lactarius sanguifluus]
MCSEVFSTAQPEEFHFAHPGHRVGYEGYKTEEYQPGEYEERPEPELQYPPKRYATEEYTPENYDPDKPDLELQYLTTEANLMDDKGGPLTKEEEEELAQIVYSECEGGDDDWSQQWPPVCFMPPEDPGSPSKDVEKEWRLASLTSTEESTLETDWRPVSPVFPETPVSPDLGFLSPPSAILKGTKEEPLEVFNVAHPGLPIYEMEIGPPKSKSPMNAPSFISVNTILDMGAKSNYLTARKARLAGAQVFPITTREIVGAGRTTTMAFASPTSIW